MRTLVVCAACVRCPCCRRRGRSNGDHLPNPRPWRSSGRTSPRVQAARAGVDVARADVLAAARMAESARDLQPRGGGRHRRRTWSWWRSCCRSPAAARLEVSAASARVEASCAPGRRPGPAPPRRSAAGVHRSVGGAGRANASWRAAAIGCASWRTCSAGARPPASRRVRPAARRARGDRRRSRPRRRRRRPRPGAGACWPASSPRRPTRDVDRGASGPTAARRRCRRSTSWWRAPRRRAASSSHCSTSSMRPRFAEQAAGRRRIPEPEVVARHQVVERRRRRHRQRLQRARRRCRCSIAAQPERAAAQARGAQVARRGRGASPDGPRADRRVARRRRRAARRSPTAIAPRSAASAEQIERIAQVSYEAGERGILELLDAYRTASSARVRQAALDAAVREAEIELEFVSGWEIP